MVCIFLVPPSGRFTLIGSAVGTRVRCTTSFVSHTGTAIAVPCSTWLSINSSMLYSSSARWSSTVNICVIASRIVSTSSNPANTPVASSSNGAPSAKMPRRICVLSVFAFLATMNRDMRASRVPWLLQSRS